MTTDPTKPGLTGRSRSHSMGLGVFTIVSLVYMSAATHAATLPPLDEIVMYEANMRAMSIAGDFAGVTDRLDEIEALGVNTIWIMPLHPVGILNRYGPLGSPYSVRDYLAVAPEYGTINDLHTLIDAAHARGIAVIMDWSGNHTAWDHPWITQHPEWYTQDSQGNIVHPPGTNWLDVADLNYDVPEMQSAMIDRLIWWVQHTQIDGFRMDAADFIPNDFWSQAVPAVRASVQRPLLMFAEGARDDHHAAGFDLTFGWRFNTGLRRVLIDGWSAAEIARSHSEEYANITAGHGVVRWTTNHDDTAYNAPPPVLFGGIEPSIAAYASMVMYGATPLIYSGQEVGSTDNTQFVELDPIDWNTNPELADWYSWIIGIRQQHGSIRSGSITDLSSDDALVVSRMLGDERVAAWINVRPYPVAAPVPAAWATVWTDLETDQAQHIQNQRALDAHEIRIARLDVWPAFIVSGALQTEQGDPADWDPAQSSLIFDRTGPVYTVTAQNLLDGVIYDLEILTDRGLPPVDTADPRITSGLRAVGDADGFITISVDVSGTNNKGEPVVWIDTDAAPLQAVGNFMDEAGGAADWNPADASFAMTPLGQGRYFYDATISTPGSYAFKASYGSGWSHQVGTDGFNDDARVLAFETAETNQKVRLIVDLRAQRLEALANLCPPDINNDGTLNFFDVSAFLAAFNSDNPLADFTGDGDLNFFDVSAFLMAFNAGCAAL